MQGNQRSWALRLLPCKEVIYLWAVIIALIGQIVASFRRPKATKLLLLDENQKEVSMIVINSDKKRTFSIQPVDSKGRPARVDGIPNWSVSPEGGVSLKPSDDGMKCEVAWVA